MDHSPYRKYANVVYVFAVLSLAVEACGNRALKIPTSVSDEEYFVYAAWIKHHFAKQPERLLLASRTFSFDPLGSWGCGGKLFRDVGHLDPSLLQALHGLGEAEFPVQTGKFKGPRFRIPWEYEESDGSIDESSHPFNRISFSRVVFNRDKTVALFAVSNLTSSLSGGGGPLIADRRGLDWVFRSNLGCVWFY